MGVLRRIEHAERKSAATPLGCDDSPGLGHEVGRGVFVGVLRSIFASWSLFSTGSGGPLSALGWLGGPCSALTKRKFRSILDLPPGRMENGPETE